MPGTWLIKKDFPHLADGLGAFDKHPCRTGESDYEFAERMCMRTRMPIGPGMPTANLNIPRSTRCRDVNSR